MAKAHRYFPCDPLEQSSAFISTNVKIWAVEKREISFRKEHKQKQVLAWPGITVISQL